MHVSGGSLTLTHATLLLDNAESLVVNGGASVRYELPAPLGRYINAPNSDAQELASVAGDFPFACAPGVSGNSSAVSAQNGPQCSGLCPPGFMCPGATGDPAPCIAGGYCAGGNPRAEPCPAGTWSNVPGASDASQCTRALPGYYSTGGTIKALQCGGPSLFCPGGESAPRTVTPGLMIGSPA